jgi:hypothetical protein
MRCEHAGKSITSNARAGRPTCDDEREPSITFECYGTPSANMRRAARMKCDNVGMLATPQRALMIVENRPSKAWWTATP